MADKQVQWRAFLKKNGLASTPDELEKIIGSISKFMEPAINAASKGAPLAKTWRPGGPWRRIELFKEGDVNA